MAKTIPTKKKVVAKAKTKAARNKEIQAIFDPKNAKAIERATKNLLDELDEQVERRWNFARPIYDAQDDKTRAYIDAMVETMKRMSHDPPRATLRIEGWDGEIPVNVDPKIQERDLYYVAIRMLIACAKWDIQIANFKLVKGSCATCGGRVK